MKCAAVWIACLPVVPAAAQSPAVMKRLTRRYDVVYPYQNDGMILVNKGGRRISVPQQDNGKYGYVDTLGREVVPLKYDAAQQFRNGRAVVGIRKNGALKYGQIDRTGALTLPVEWDDLGSLNDGVTVAMRKAADGTWTHSLIDTLGGIVPLEYALCEDFKNGLAVVGVGRLEIKQVRVPGLKAAESIEFKGKYGYITPDGKLAVPTIYDKARPFGEDGLAPVGRQGKYYVKWGFIDTEGREVIPCNYYSVDYFEQGLAMVSRVVTGGKVAYGYIDRSGEEVIPCRYDEATRFKFRNTWVGTMQNGRMHYTLIDAKGNAVLPYPVYNLQDGGKYGQAVAAVPDDMGRLRYGIIGFSGKIVLPFDYDEITIFTDLDPVTLQHHERAIATRDGRQLSFDISKKRP